MERNDYIHIFNKFLENKATPSEIKLLIEWLKERKAFDTWADDIWMQSPMEMDPSVKQHLLDELRKQIFFKETGKRTFMSLSLPSLFHYALRITAIILLLITTSIVTYHYAMDKQREPMDMIVAVEKGQKANITLPDGSKGWINSDSKLSYGSRFNADERMLLTLLPFVIRGVMGRKRRMKRSLTISSGVIFSSFSCMTRMTWANSVTVRHSTICAR